MRINEIGRPEGANRPTKRRGRGSGSGHGKTSCRGRKGAKKRSGRMTRPGFEGGQMPLVRRLPKKGFTAPFKKFYQVVNVESLNTFRDKTTVGPAELKEAGLIGSEQEMVKILGTGSLTKALVIKAHKVSGSAAKKITESGSTLEFLGKALATVPVTQPKASPKIERAKTENVKDKRTTNDERRTTKQ